MGWMRRAWLRELRQRANVLEIGLGRFQIPHVVPIPVRVTASKYPEAVLEFDRAKILSLSKGCAQIRSDPGDSVGGFPNVIVNNWSLEEHVQEGSDNPYLALVGGNRHRLSGREA